MTGLVCCHYDKNVGLEWRTYHTEGDKGNKDGLISTWQISSNTLNMTLERIKPVSVLTIYMGGKYSIIICQGV